MWRLCFQSRFDPSVQIRGRGKPVLPDSYSVMQKKTWVITGKMCRWSMFGELQLLVGAGRCNAVCLVNEVIESKSFSCRQMEIYEPGKACPERDLWREAVSWAMWEHGGQNGQAALGSFLCQVLAEKDNRGFGHKQGGNESGWGGHFCVCKPYIYFRLSLTSVWLSSASILK